MLDVDITKLEQVVNDMRATLREGLLACDIWDRATGLAISAHESQPEAVALFNRLTNELQETLTGSGFPGINRFYLCDLEGDRMCVVMRNRDDMLAGMLLDATKVNLGILMSIAIPKMIAGLEAARS